MAIRVVALSLTPVKGTRLQRVESVEFDVAGAAGDRRFLILDERDRMVNSKNLGGLTTVLAHSADGRLSLTFPGNRVVCAPVELGDPFTASFYSEAREVQPVEGPFSAALSEHVGRTLRLVHSPGAIDRGPRGAVTLISRASLDLLAREAGQDEIDTRRFRMTLEVDGVGANEEDGWIGRAFRVGTATIRFHGHVGRCLITSRHPDTGEIDLPTLDVIGEYRRDLDTTEPLPLGIYGEVASPGAVRLGDELTPAAV